MRRTLLAGLIANPDPAVLTLLRQRFGEKGNPDYLDGGILDRLEAAGEDIDGLDEHAGQTLEHFRQLAEAHKKKIPVAVTRAWRPEIAHILEPLGERLGQWTLLKAQEAQGDRLPRMVSQVFSLLPPASRADFTEMAVAHWVTGAGKAADQWLMRFLPAYADDRVVNHLAKVIKTWAKGRKTKAVEALHYLCAVPGNFGPSRVQEAMESPSYSDSIIRGARAALQQAAAARGLTLKDYLDELIPDFGVGPDGLELDLGPYSYRVKILSDLSLRVVNHKGKATKSLPKARAEEDSDKRGLAENAFKILRKNLKPIANQQVKRLHAAMVANKRWPMPRWRRLFVEHPILHPLAQALVWSSTDEAGADIRFRPAEDRSLIDHDDNEVAPAQDAQVHLIHPAELPVEALAAWKEHLADYELTPPFEQLDAPIFMPSDEERRQEELIRHRGYVFPYAKLKCTPYMFYFCEQSVIFILY